MLRSRTCVHHFVEDHAASNPEAIALLAPGRQPLTYGRLWQHVCDTAALLNGCGIAEQDVVAVVLANGPELAAAFLAVSATAACAPLNPAYRAPEFDAVLRALSPRALIVQAGVPSEARGAAATLGIPVIDLTPAADEPAGLFRLDVSTAVRSDCPRGLANGDSVALVLHTSGTTAQPKQVRLTQANLWHSARNIAEALELCPSDRCLNVMPLFHVHGLAAAVIASLASGASVVCAPDFVAPRFFDWIDEFEPTWYTAVPTIHAAVVARAAQHSGSRARAQLRFVRSSSAPLPRPLLADLEALFGVPAIEAYGMTEAAHQIASNPLPPRARKPGSVGLAVGAEIAVVDDRGAPVDAGTEGDIVIRGPNVAGAGWLATGDRGRLDDDGYLFLTSRTKDVINRGGEKVAPREIEDVLHAHPAVLDAACFAAPDARLGEHVAAAIVLRAGTDVAASDLREFAAARLADFKVPSRIVFVHEIPTGPTGKPQRTTLASTFSVLPDRELSGPREEPASPPTAAEELVRRVWSDVLDLDTVGVHDDFFALGGDSILATQVLSRLHAATGISLSMTRFLDAPTVSAMAARLAAAPREVESSAPTATIPTATRGDRVPVSHTQQGIWILSQLDPQNPVYNLSMSLRLDGPLDEAALEVGSSRVDLQACKLEYSIVSPK